MVDEDPHEKAAIAKARVQKQEPSQSDWSADNDAEYEGLTKKRDYDRQRYQNKKRGK